MRGHFARVAFRSSNRQYVPLEVEVEALFRGASGTEHIHGESRCLRVYHDTEKGLDLLRRPCARRVEQEKNGQTANKAQPH